MKSEVVLWIDHHKTIIVTKTDEQENTQEVRSNIEKHIRLSGGKSPKELNLSTLSEAEDVADHRHDNRLSSYYDGVLSLLRNADSIRIFGPGEAKVELKKRLEQGGLGDRIASVETAGKLTNRQLASKVQTDADDSS